MKETETAKLLRDRTTLRYMGDCKCGKCQLVPRYLVARAADEIDTLTSILNRLDPAWSET